MSEEVEPYDATVVKNILRSMGVTEYEPRVVNQLLEFMYRYVAETLEDAQVYSEYATKTEIDLEYVKLAIQSRVNFTFSQPPPRELLLELASQKNSIPLPFASDKAPGLRLPPLEHQLTTPNYQVTGTASASSATTS
eukprot:TRINITY_DN18815_c0_g1::TRINITY_DN18815_c0_g1_i1::g.15198::m.15198 TRINITY_DN18815_c0_g1::TRINITY_DN18815_c0_g1_i1::g.15198  ORF type:complete len:146 (-),score=8.62,sp/Q9SYH2/TAF9_ARATH/61.29/7e-47,TFIID-31kDa/PF02291.10/1.9e-39,Bromo_TP/PF07524.8/0.00063,CENP-S/PF15630.1/0.0027,Histone/PF00125.19/0.15 TRINITY_DN18815_c0_g1_i1:466-876(-)